MGMYATGHVAFGIDLGERNPFVEYEDNGYGPEPVDPDDERAFERDLGDYLALRAGIKDPYADWPREIYNAPARDAEAWIAENRPDHERDVKVWFAETRRLEEAAPIEVVQYGHYDGEHLYFLALRGTYSSAIYEAEAFNPGAVSRTKVTAAVRFCEANGLPAFSEPGWHVMSSYG